MAYSQPKFESSAAITIERALHGDLAKIASLHCDAFPRFFLTRLGPRFLQEYYRAIFEWEDGILLIARDGSGNAKGFVAGFVAPERFYRELRRRRVRLAAAALPAIVRHPELLTRFLRNSQRVERASGAIASLRSSELSSLGVAPDASGSGVGTRLVQAFLEASRSLAAFDVSLTTDADENDRVISFYKRLGFSQREMLESPGNRRMYRYGLQLASPIEIWTNG